MKYIKSFETMEDLCEFKKYIDSVSINEAFFLKCGDYRQIFLTSDFLDKIILTTDNENDEAIISILKSKKVLGEKYKYDYTSTISISDLNNIVSLGNSFCSEIVNKKLLINADALNITDLTCLQYCNSIEDITGIDSGKYQNMFGMVYLNKVKLPKQLTEIGHSAFAFCISLKEVGLPAKLKTIRNKAFFNCSSLAEISIPASTTILEDNIFLKCDKLERIIFKGLTPPKISSKTFNGCAETFKIYVSEKGYNNYIEQWPELSDRIIMA